VWYQPYKFSPRTRLFGPYAHRVENNGITLTYVWSSGSYNYPSHAWYRTGAQTSTETRITPPYFDVDHVYISAVHGMFVNGAFAGVTTTDMTSESIDTFLQAISSRRHVLYVTDLSGRVVAFPNTAALIAFARARHPVRRILDVTDADARAFLRMHYGKDTVLLQRRATPMPLVLVDAWDPATLGPAVPLSLLIAIGVLLWVAAAAAMILLWHTRVNTQHTLNVHREHSRLLMEIESHVRAERALRRAAEVDRMTGLSDRATFMRDLERRVTSPPDAASSTALLLLDVNNLDALNEAYGRQTGDRVLMHVAALARRCCGRYDVAARFESDQFAVLVSGDAERRGRAIADCVQRGMSAGLEVDGQRLFFDSAAGFVTVGPEHAHAQDVLRDADDALYYAKRTGHAFVEFTQQLREEAHRDREMRAALRGALERGEMYCVYQPIYRLDTRAVVGLEALARWQRGETTVYPAQFIPLAERTGLVLEVDRYIAETATKVVSQLRDGVPIALSINVSALHFKHRAAFEALQTSLERGRLGHGMLNVELTETALMTLSSTSRDFVQQIHALGVGMHLDDFGTGYSSLSYLQHLHVDALKIDRSFVAAMLGDERARQIVELIVQLARRFRIETIAEGIESAAQEDALRDLGVTMGQGLFFAAPVRARDLPDILGAVHRK
jgi:diguanylate cyclase (GGDEF)-like protein